MKTRNRVEKFAKLQRLRRFIIRGNIGIVFFELLPSDSMISMIQKQSVFPGNNENTTTVSRSDTSGKSLIDPQYLPTRKYIQHKCFNAMQTLRNCFSSKASPRPLEKTLLPTSEDIQQTVFCALPYLSFLLFFALNSYVQILPTVENARCVTLYNVSLWESYFLPIPVNRIIASVQHPLLDLLAALPYLAHYCLPVLYPVYLYWATKRFNLIAQFYRLLGWTMWFHYAIWFLLPTFPPWAVITQSLNDSLTPVIALTQREGRAFSRVDRLINLPLFHNLFAGNPVPFASFPSGHVAWPTCILLTLPPSGSLTFSLYIALLSWATMYSDHHYLLDAIGATVVVAVTHKLITWITKPPLHLTRSINGLSPV